VAVSDLPKFVRNAGRLHEVVSVALKYGLAPWMSNIKADWIHRHLRSADGQQISGLSEPVRVRMALTELVTTFIKLGQILSTRADLVGPELAQELSQLQSGTPADSPAEVVQTITEESSNNCPVPFVQSTRRACSSQRVPDTYFLAEMPKHVRLGFRSVAEGSSPKS